MKIAQAAVGGRLDTDTFLRGIWRENPVLVHVMGMCPALAVTNSVLNALSMGAATAFVLIMSSIIVSALRRFIPHQVRMATYIMIIATFVTVVENVVQAISLEIHKGLGAYTALIVVNCFILGRAEAYASKNPVGRSFLDAAGMGLGFAVALLCMGVIRELLGSGTLLGFSILGSHHQPWVIMVLPAGGFFTLGGLLLFFNWLQNDTKNPRREAPSSGGHCHIA